MNTYIGAGKCGGRTFSVGIRKLVHTTWCHPSFTQKSAQLTVLTGDLRPSCGAGARTNVRLACSLRRLTVSSLRRSKSSRAQPTPPPRKYARARAFLLDSRLISAGRAEYHLFPQIPVNLVSRCDDMRLTVSLPTWSQIPAVEVTPDSKLCCNSVTKTSWLFRQPAAPEARCDRLLAERAFA